MSSNVRPSPAPQTLRSAVLRAAFFAIAIPILEALGSIGLSQAEFAADGIFFADAETLKRIEDNNQVVFRYVDSPNGSVNDIAGIMNEAGNVIGLMPHPDRAFEAELGSADGATFFQSIYAAL